MSKRYDPLRSARKTSDYFRDEFGRLWKKAKRGWKRVKKAEK